MSVWEREVELSGMERPPTLRALKTTLDALLLPEGFNRSGVSWIRLRNTFHDVIELQTASYDRMRFTVNVGVCDPQVFNQIWGRELPKKLSATDCVVESRIGYITGQTDVWWDLGNQGVVNEVSKDLERAVVPFFRSQQSHKDMLDWLLKSKILKYMYPLERIKVAVLYHSIGDFDSARQLLQAELGHGQSDHWYDRVKFVISGLQIQLGEN